MVKYTLRTTLSWTILFQIHRLIISVDFDASVDEWAVGDGWCHLTQSVTALVWKQKLPGIIFPDLELDQVLFDVDTNGVDPIENVDGGLAVEMIHLKLKGCGFDSSCPRFIF